MHTPPAVGKGQLPGVYKQLDEGARAGRLQAPPSREVWLLHVHAQDVTIMNLMQGKGLQNARELAGGIEGEGDDDAVEDGADVAVHDAVVQAVEVLPVRHLVAVSGLTLISV
jgi:hypothetical protein